MPTNQVSEFNFATSGGMYDSKFTSHTRDNLAYDNTSQLPVHSVMTVVSSCI